jgi:4-aminobutyrate aminotransferase / (S)-3-amino-2-methylpropionate transaminase / 5-aminovalerate transaminase
MVYMSVTEKTPSVVADQLLQLQSQYVPKGVSVQNRVVISHAEGARLWDVQGHEYLDFAGGIGVLNIGHSNPEIVKAVQEQAEKLFHTCVHVTLNEPYLRLVEQLCRIAPIAGEKKALLLNSGAEAVENAIKVAKSYTGRSAVIAFESAFHGRTTLGLSLTSKVHPYKANFGPFVPEIYRLPFPNLYHRPKGQREEEFIDLAIENVRKSFDTYVDANNVAAIIIEPVQGEGGFVVTPPRYLQALREICAGRGIVFIVDEIQTGFARTGKMFATEHYEGLNPDIITMAKSMGAGLPISAVVGRAEILDATEVGGLGGTYGGNPLAAVAALKVIEIMERDNLPHRSETMGARAMDYLKELQKKYPIIGDVRGQGSMIAMEFVTDPVTKMPNAQAVARISEKCLARGLITVKAGIYNNVIRLLAPLVITDEELARGLGIIADAIAQAVVDLEVAASSK